MLLLLDFSVSLYLLNEYGSGKLVYVHSRYFSGQLRNNLGTILGWHT